MHPFLRSRPWRFVFPGAGSPARGGRSGGPPVRALARATGPALVAAMFLALALAWSLSLPPGVFGIGFEGARRDAFPVFNEPAMLGAAEAEAAGVIFPRDAVIGVSLGGEAKAYPIAIMGFHELGNDTLGGVPIAISW